MSDRQKRFALALVAALALTAGAIWAGLGAARGMAAGDSPAPPGSAAFDPGAGLDWAVFAGGCFWCVEADFDHVEGVLETTSGFSGGRTINPTYEAVTRGGTGHMEAVRVVFDPRIVTYRQLVDYFWRHVDPLDAGGQFCDRGESYVTALFPRGAQQAQIIAASKADAEAELGRAFATRILPFEAFYAADAYHQDYYLKNALRYRYYRFACGRDRRVRELWGEAAH